jgi:hypothetical protein
VSLPGEESAAEYDAYWGDDDETVEPETDAPADEWDDARDGPAADRYADEFFGKLLDGPK